MNTVKIQAVSGQIFEGTVIATERGGEFVVVDLGASEIRVHVSELVK